jgi:hypothetical protein
VNNVFGKQLNDLVLEALQNGAGLQTVIASLKMQAEVLATLAPYHNAIVNGRAAP